MTKKQIKAIEKRVDRGIKWLDKKRPGWHKKIVFKNLDMGGLKTCICGQVFGNYMNVTFSTDRYGKSAVSLGFITKDSLLDGEDHWDALGEVWKQKIREYRKKLKK